MLMIVLAVLASFIPSMFFYFWFQNRKKDDTDYRKTCTKVLGSGMLSVFPVTAASMSLNILMNLTLKGRVPLLIQEAFYKFIVLAFAEEFVKYMTGRKYVLQRKENVSWMDIAAFMTIAACGFNIIESVVYAIGSDVITILVRGVTALHEFYGMIMGYYIGKRFCTGNKKYLLPAFLIPWFLHGLYDYSLSKELLAVNDNLVFLPFLAILLTWIIGFRVFIKLIKGRNDPMYTSPLHDVH